MFWLTGWTWGPIVLIMYCSLKTRLYLIFWFFSYFKAFLVNIYPKEQNEIIRRSYNLLLYVLQAFHWFECNARHDWIFVFLTSIFNKNGHIPPLLMFLSVYIYPLIIRNIHSFPMAKKLKFFQKWDFCTVFRDGHYISDSPN